MQRFRLISWAGERLEERPEALSAEFVENSNKMASEFLNVVLGLVLERTVEGVSSVSRRDRLRSELIQVRSEYSWYLLRGFFGLGSILGQG